jgi:hypothetical protein
MSFKSKKFKATSSIKQMGTNLFTTVNISKTGKNLNIESKEVFELYKEFKKTALQTNPNSKILVRGDNPLQDHWTLKGFGEDDLKFEDYDEYFQNRVKDPAKFAKFTSLSFVMQTENTNNVQIKF